MHAHARDCVRAHAHGRTNTTFFPMAWFHNCYGSSRATIATDCFILYIRLITKITTDQIKPNLLRIKLSQHCYGSKLGLKSVRLIWIFRNCTSFLEIVDIGFFNTKVENLRNGMPILLYSSWNLVKLHADSFKVRVLLATRNLNL